MIDTISPQLVLLLIILRFGQADTQSQVCGNHDEVLARIASLDKVLKRANNHLLRWSAANPGGPQTNGSCSPAKMLLEEEDAESIAAVQTLKKSIRTAKSVRKTSESTYDPDGRSMVRFSEDSASEAYDVEHYRESDMDDPRPEDIHRVHDRISPNAAIIHRSFDHDEPIPLEVLSSLIEDLKQNAKEAFQAGNLNRAEMNLVEAIQPGEERESKYGIPFRERIEIQETLATIYQKQKKWAEARKILHGLLQDIGHSGSESAAQKELQFSRMYHLLATVHLEMYEAQPSHKNPSEAIDLKLAEKFAQLAFNTKHRLRDAMMDRGDLDFHGSVQVLIKVLDAQGRTACAQSYHRQFMASGTSTNLVPDEHLGSLTSASGYDFDVSLIDDLLISPAPSYQDA